MINTALITAFEFFTIANPLKVFPSCDIVLSVHRLKFLLLINTIEDLRGFTFLVCNGNRFLFYSFSHETSTIFLCTSSKYPCFSQVRSPLRSLAFVLYCNTHPFKDLYNDTYTFIVAKKVSCSSPGRDKTVNDSCRTLVDRCECH